MLAVIGCVVAFQLALIIVALSDIARAIREHRP